MKQHLKNIYEDFNLEDLPTTDKVRKEWVVPIIKKLKSKHGIPGDIYFTGSLAKKESGGDVDLIFDYTDDNWDKVNDKIFSFMFKLSKEYTNKYFLITTEDDPDREEKLEIIKKHFDYWPTRTGGKYYYLKDLKVDSYIKMNPKWLENKKWVNEFINKHDVPKNRIDEVKYLILTTGGGWAFALGFTYKDQGKNKVKI